jgi:sulfonate transport system permease protein
LNAETEDIERVGADEELWHGPALPRRLAWQRLPRPVRRLLGPIVLLAAWELASVLGLLNNQMLAGPGAVISTAVQLIQTGELQGALLASLQRVAIGLSIGTAFGLILALVSGLISLGEDLIDGPMQILRALPILALVPLDIVWFGIGEEAKDLLIAFGVAFPIYINTYAAIRGIDPKLIELSRTLRLRRWEVLRRIVLPGAIPGFIVGFRFAAAVAWLILVVVEQVNANSGLGYMMNQAQVLDQTNVILVGLLIYGLLGLTSDTLIRFLERRVTTWRPSVAAGR